MPPSRGRSSTRSLPPLRRLPPPPPFPQESNFHYLTGLEEPDCLLCITKDGVFHLFVQEKSEEFELWNGYVAHPAPPPPPAFFGRERGGEGWREEAKDWLPQMGKSGFQLEGRGVNRASQNWGAGFRKRLRHSSIILNSGAEGARIFPSIENGQIFSPNTSQMMIFLKALNTLIPKIQFSFFAEFGPGLPSEPRASLGRILAGRQLSPFLLGGSRPPPPR